MFKLSMIGGALAASMMFTTAAYAAPPRNRIIIDVVTANGSGCPIGTTAVAMSPDNTAFTVTYSRYIAQTGAGSDPFAFRRNCQLNLNVHVPNGLTFAVMSVDYRGFGHLARGASGRHEANYYFQGQPLNQRLATPFRGPMDRNWQIRDQAGIAERVYRPCGVQRNLNINTELRVNRGSSSPRQASFLTMDSTDTAISTVYHLTWKRCGR
ncbi:DUF4360 domain-containing protein [Luedemannella flava]|uniref:DUF4360 domain-containing protein n=1 Tax=Luedemannella flava TaxID=349316 RepID=A0ABN2LID6_9ACTN